MATVSSYLHRSEIYYKENYHLLAQTGHQANKMMKLVKANKLTHLKSSSSNNSNKLAQTL